MSEKRPSEKLFGRVSDGLVAFAGWLPIVGGRVCGISHARGGWKLKQRVRAEGAHPTHAGYAGFYLVINSCMGWFNK